MIARIDVKFIQTSSGLLGSLKVSSHFSEACILHKGDVCISILKVDLKYFSNVPLAIVISGHPVISGWFYLVAFWRLAGILSGDVFATCKANPHSSKMFPLQRSVLADLVSLPSMYLHRSGHGLEFSKTIYFLLGSLAVSLNNKPLFLLALGRLPVWGPSVISSSSISWKEFDFALLLNLLAFSRFSFLRLANALSGRRMLGV